MSSPDGHVGETGGELSCWRYDMRPLVSASLLKSAKIEELILRNQ